jgi:hypothetical protein
MYSTQAYIYQQITQVLSIDTSGAGDTFLYRYNPVYAKVLTINKGVDNVLLFEFINQQEKPVNITGSNFMFRVISTDGTKILFEAPLVTLNAATGRAKVTIGSADMLEVQAQPASYSITRASGNLNEAVFTDAQSGGRAPCTIADSVLPQHVPSAPLLIPTVKLAAQTSFDGAAWEEYPSNPYWQGNPNGGNYYNSFINTEFYSSNFEPVNAITTVQMTLDGYTGTIKAQAAQDYQSIFYNVSESVTYYNYTGTIYHNIVGWYPLLRMCFNNSIFAVPDQPSSPATAYAQTTNGVVTAINVTNGGSGYLAPPKIEIVGDGSGAKAVAIVDQGVVTGIEVVDGGSGYWYIPNAGMGAGLFPNSANQTGAAVVISTGYVLDILYR